MTIIGFDPGIAITGFGVVRSWAGARFEYVTSGCIRTTSGQSLSDRLLSIYNDCRELLDRYDPAAAAVERLFVRAHLQNALSVGQVRGVILLALAQKRLPPGEYTSMEVRQAVLGYGKAAKGQVQFMVARLLSLQTAPTPDDAADALAVALCHGMRAAVQARRA
ncbi:MAG: crossover junction endodeoxyribonuclease RuvC [Candidatus Riflebacteria bacterium]|nr:crossover junction endodeoxyribonuclease RuvC [Candidatus Riflebacteria bacterium]